MADWQILLKLIVSNILSGRSIMIIFFTSLTMIIGALLASTYTVISSSIKTAPIWLWGVCIFCFYFLVVDKWKTKKTAKKETREKERLSEEKAKQKELWYLNQKSRLNNLNPDEQKILSGYVVNKTYTQTLPVTSGVVIGLENDGIIQRVGDIPNDNNWGFDFNIDKWISEYLNNNPELIGINKPSNEKNSIQEVV